MVEPDQLLHQIKITIAGIEPPIRRRDPLAGLKAI